jgi:hypothetical protein
MTAIAGGLYGALLLAQGRAEGLERVEAGWDGAARSFWAAALSLPAFLFTRLMDWNASGMPPHPGHAMALELLSYVIGWAGFALLSRSAVAMLGRAERWTLYVAVWNWCNVVQYLLVVASFVPRLLGAPAWVDQTSELIAIGWAIWLEWYATRLALDVGRIGGAALVLLDLSVGLFLSGLTILLY